ncbi:hypothetical protein ACFUC1_09080 [Pedococcus sp. NPDC057267]|uniref:hypothetical protein n=1 Tax=Pedococcus sp. NPDC057267 TaxID=3346077 RepID=UPI003633E5BE
MVPEVNRREPLPVRSPGHAVHAEALTGDVTSVTRLRCPSCSAEMSSVVEHALGSDFRDGPVRWTSEAEVVSATLRGLRASLTPAPSPTAVVESMAAPSPPEQPHLRLVPPVDASREAEVPAPEPGAEPPAEPGAEPAAVPEPPVLEEPSTPDGRGPAARRRKHGFFARVLTVRTFRGEREQAKAARDHDARVESLLGAAADDGVLSLHHRRLPGRRGEVAHLAIGPAGVVVVHTRSLQDPNTAGTVRAQVSAVRAELAAVSLDNVSVDGVLCTGGSAPSVESDTDDVLVVAPGDLGPLLAAPGPLSEEHRQTLHEFLSAQLPATR